ncbi:tRNA pseudouridine(38-40) synthase TruA [Capnocytophaga catalasegens]|uniref:tRNA pseudouridine synthase A n=1 Tax=Capnocytophaga catalasegens TaxID=1004260 RepID=A0AAV5AU89_9FLAO|nr:tRNA pseudouridine(38-40) synthase TruA [Capnocytophaga catalasegens]GIZ15365.1 tRNA pseudouridine synthase A [Capnocytophaga catalasegens]GJM50953.1 tRNA pseudouridine synthase A [Capnocytophaga catalasegens]GJM52137.1 tRNA pseudouridine synthase A [Capnocytophaga catalasegens]
MRYFVEFAYNGKAYCGWQSQPNSVSVQQIMEHSLSVLLSCPIALTGAGRTDSGVHSRQMFAHFDYEGIIQHNFVHRVNTFLPHDIVIYGFYQVENEAHARFDALKRTYQYYIVQHRNPFLTDFAYHFQWSLDIDSMNKACEILKTYTDFQCFSKSKTDIKTYLCKIEKAFWERNNENILIFEITADRFLRNMVRAIVGTMLNIGQGKLTLEGFKQVIESKNRGKAGFSVPAHGLYLTQVVYPERLFKPVK